MKKIAMAAMALALCAASGLQAQTHTTCPQQCKNATATNCQQQEKKQHNTFSPETRAMMRADRMSQQLELTDAQKKKLVAVFTEEENTRAAKQQNMQAERAKMQEQMKAERAKTDAEIEKIIGAEKMATYKADRARASQQQGVGPQRMPVRK